jgi:hypothetical protein
MPLHRDIFWIGRQWAVTGFGMQAVNQKHDGQFDIPVERLWDDDLLDAVRDRKWFNPDDFNKGLEIARARHPRPPAKPAPPPLPVETLLREHDVVPPVISSPGIAAAELPERATAVEKMPKPPPSFPELRIVSHSAKLLRVWRARRRR